jgi:hypothetical protein
MPQKRLLYLDANQLGAWSWHGGTLKEEGLFAQNEDGLAAFSEYLARHRNSLFYLLADLAEEGFQIEALPYTQGADRGALLARKLGQHFYGSPLATAVSYGREKEGRRDEKILFTALTQPKQVEPWLAALRSAEAQLAGVYSLPLISAATIGKLAPGQEHCLLIILTRGGIRQSFFERGQLRFSRLTPMTATAPGEIAAGCAAEATRIWQYLVGQRLLTRGAPPAIFALAHPAQSNAFVEQWQKSTDLPLTLLDLHAASRALGLKSPPKDSRSEALFLHVLAQRPPREQFAQPVERRFYRLWQVRDWLVKGGALVLLGCLLFAGREMAELLKMRSATETMLQQTEADQRRYQAIQKTYPPMPASPDNLRAVVNRFEELEKRSAPLEPLYLAVSRALAEVPRVEIERLQWQVSANPDEGLQASADPRKPPAGSGPAAAQAGAGMYQTALIHGLLPSSMAADQRAQLETVNAFVAALRKDAVLRVTVVRMPFDIESGKSLKSTKESEQKAVQLKFVTHLSRRL